MMINKPGFLCIVVLLLFTSYPAMHVKGQAALYSVNKRTKVDVLSSQDSLLLCADISGIEFTALVGIQIDGVNHTFTSGISSLCPIPGSDAEIRYYSLREKDSPVLLEIAVFDQGFAFRYTSDKNKAMHIEGERSAFEVHGKCRVWFFERKNDWKLKSYAGTWENCPIEQLPVVSGKNTVQGLPLLFEYPDGKIAVSAEVNLQNYSGLRWDCSTPGWLKADFTEGHEGFTVDGGLCTPWRLMFVADNLNDLVNQQIIRQLSPSPDEELYANTDYILPGKAVWRWFSRDTGKTPEEEREFIDYASRLGFRYSIIDDGWNQWSNKWEELAGLSAYGDKKNVKLFVWNDSKNINDPRRDYETMRLWLDSVATAGVSGVKVDFMNSESKEWIDFDIRLLKECARRRLLVNFHGCQSPAGEQYIFPNELTREGIRGLELNKLAEGPIPSYHNALLPFTRFVTGHGDYTPLSFVHPGNTTFAHQLATLVAFNSPMQVIAEDPEVLLSEPSVIPALDFIKAVPTVWDETVVLSPTQLGKTAVVARRGGGDWYIYALNGTDEACGFTLNLIEIDPLAVQKELILFADDMQAKLRKIEREEHRPSPLIQKPVIPFKKHRYTGKTEIEIRLVPHGGAVVWLRSK